MRKNHADYSNNTKILLLDDEKGIIESLSVVLKKSGYYTEGVTSPLEAVSKLQNEHFDILILDYLMVPIHGDKVVEKVRQFDNDIYIILLTGHKDLVPPLETIKNLQIQAYCEKSDSFDQLLLLVESGRKSVTHTYGLSLYQNGLSKIIDFIPQMYHFQTIEQTLEGIINNVYDCVNVENAFIYVFDPINKKNIIKGIGKFQSGIKSLDDEMLNNLNKVRDSKAILKSEYGTWFPVGNNTDAFGAIYLEFEYEEFVNKLIEIFVKQISSFIDFAFLQSLIKIRNSELAAHYAEDKNEFNQLINIFKLLINNGDYRMKGHGERVAYYSVKIGETFDLDKNELELLKNCGLLHDIFQNMGIDDINIDMDDSQKYYAAIKHISQITDTFKQIAAFKEIGSIIETHHERADGNGYPQGLTESEIPFLSKIIAVADTFDVLNIGHIGMDEVKKNLINGKNILFDANIVDNFIGLLDDYYLMEEELKDTYL